MLQVKHLDDYLSLVCKMKSIAMEQLIMDLGEILDRENFIERVCCFFT